VGRVTVSIVNFNTWPTTLSCVAALTESAQADEYELQIVIHDNGLEAPPDTPWARECLEGVIVIRSPSNLGYGQGHNSNMAFLQGDHVLLLNPDIKISPESVATLVEALQADESLGATAPQLLDPDGGVQLSCRRLPRLEFEAFRLLGLDRLKHWPFSLPLMRDWSHRTERIVEQPAGAAIMMRSRDFVALGGFSDRFFMYFEDVDLCRRIAAQIGPILFTPRAKAVHDREGTARKYRRETTFWLEWSRRIYYESTETSSVRRMIQQLLAIMTALTRAMGLFLRGVTTPGPPREEAWGKASGYSLFLCSVAYRNESFWRRLLM
jgi:N-acetylglucosaminyl-diphospho-decaprenol L-rhamnosyltransferase